VQGREAPVQRLADSVAGRFCYTVMAASATTFGFWYLAGELFATATPVGCAFRSSCDILHLLTSMMWKQ